MICGDERKKKNVLLATQSEPTSGWNTDKKPGKGNLAKKYQAPSRGCTAWPDGGHRIDGKNNRMENIKTAKRIGTLFMESQNWSVGSNW